MTAPSRPQVTWSIWAGWTLASTFGFPTGIFASSIILQAKWSIRGIVVWAGSTFDNAISGAVVSLVLGVVQRLVVREWLRYARLWIVMSVAGWALGMALASGIVDRSIIGVALGLVVGTSQWLVLRRQVNQAGWWILATTVAWIASFIITTLQADQQALFVLITFSGAVAGIITGVAMGWLLRHPMQQPDQSAPSSVSSA